jgi:putative spermidine/putrescine transport system permease protein
VNTESNTLGRGPIRHVVFLLAGGMLALPIAATVLYSFATFWKDRALPEGFTTRWWRETLSDGRLFESLIRSLMIAGGAAVLITILVLPPLVWAHLRNPRVRTVMQACALLPFALPFVVLAYGMKSLAQATTFTQQFENSPWLLLLGHTALAFPFFLWPVDAALHAADVRRLAEAGATCGATLATTVRRVILPLARTGIVSGVALVIATSIGEYSVARLVTGTEFETVPVWQVQQLNDTSGNPNGVAVVTIAMLLLLLVLTVGLARLSRRSATSQSGPRLSHE